MLEITAMIILGCVTSALHLLLPGSVFPPGAFQFGPSIVPSRHWKCNPKIHTASAESRNLNIRCLHCVKRGKNSTANLCLVQLGFLGLLCTAAYLTSLVTCCPTKSKVYQLPLVLCSTNLQEIDSPLSALFKLTVLLFRSSSFISRGFVQVNTLMDDALC